MLPLNKRLNEWKDVKSAGYDLGVILGLFHEDYNGSTPDAPCWAFDSGTPLGITIRSLLCQLVASQLLESNEDDQFRWNSDAATRLARRTVDDQDGADARTIDDTLKRYFFKPRWPDHQIAPSESLVRGLEDVVGTYLPTDYRSFLLQHGSVASDSEDDLFLVVWVPGRQETAHFSGFLGFFRSDERHPGIRHFDLINAYRDLSWQVGSSFLPISLGERFEPQFCLKLSGEEKGSIWAWVPDRVQGETWEEMVQVYGLYRVAPDIVSFLSSIKVEPNPLN